MGSGLCIGLRIGGKSVVPAEGMNSSSRGREAFGRGDPGGTGAGLPRPAKSAGLAMTISAGTAENRSSVLKVYAVSDERNKTPDILT